MLGNKHPKFNDIHELWEYESNLKIKELIRANSFTNQNKHIRLLDLMTGSAKLGRLAGDTSPNEYFRQQFDKNQNSTPSKNSKAKKSESEKFLEEFDLILTDMEENGMPLSINEKITIANSKKAQLTGLYSTLKKKQEE